MCILILGGQKKPVHRLGFHYFNRFTKPLPCCITYTMSLLYYIYMYVFLQGCACSGVPKGEACAECFLKSKANIGGWVDLSSISFSTNIERKKSFTCKLGCKITAIVDHYSISTEFSWHGTANLSDLSPWTSRKSKHRSL